MWRVRPTANPVALEDNLELIKRKYDGTSKAHQEQLSHVESQLKKSSSPGERKALEDRKRMLLLQQTQFVKYHEFAVRKITEADRNRQDSNEGFRKFDRLANNVRCSFDMECKRLLDALPIDSSRSDIVETVINNQVCVIIGETGSGKSTQIVQYLFDAGLAIGGLIACTQPRKIAATNLATHVAEEMGSFVGQLVGHKVGGYTRIGIRTKIVYITEYYMLKECFKDRNLSAYSCIVIDEAHERSINTDLLLGMIKKCLVTRPDLRVVVTSATIDPKVFVEYFRQFTCPVLHVSGRQFPVQTMWKQRVSELDSFTNYQEEAVEKAVEVHLSEPEGDILVFVTSPMETETCCGRFNLLMRGKPGKYLTLQLHGQLEREEQQKVFDPVADGERKVIFATNSAETSVTIPRIRYVIDTGLVKEMKYDPVQKLRTLAVTKVSQSSAKQRQGRAGRLAPGKCFRLYTEDDYKEMNVHYVPEMLRVHIAQAVLKLMEFDIDPIEFKYVVSPSVDAMEEAFTTLVDIGAVENSKLTELGNWIAKLPFDPRFGAFIFEAVQDLVGLEAIVMTVASESSLALFTRERGHTASSRKNPLVSEGGDQLTALNVFREWHKLPDREKTGWCSRHSMNERLLKNIQDTAGDIILILRKELDIFVKFDFLKPETADKMLLKFLLKTWSKNLSHVFGLRKIDYYILSQNQVVALHPSSVVLSLGHPPDWIVFKEIMETTRRYAIQIMPVPESLLLKGIEEGWLQIDFEEVKKKCSATAHHKHLGPQLYREFVGSRDNMKNLEVRLTSEFPDCGITTRTRQDTGRITVLSNARDEAKFLQSFLGCFSSLIRKSELEESEQCLGSLSRPTGGSVRVAIGAGGSIKTLIMPKEFRVVKIQCTVDMANTWSEEDVLAKFSEYGKIIECNKISKAQEPSIVWGQITYQDPDSAMKAVTETKLASRMIAQPNDDIPVSSTVRLKMQIQWCRRPSRRHGCIEFTHKKAHWKALQRSYIMVDGSLAKIQYSPKGGKFVKVSEFDSYVTEHLLHEAVIENLLLSPADITKVFIARETATLDNALLDVFKNHLFDKIKQFAQPADFHLEMEEPQSEEDVYLIAYCVFNNIKEGKAACKEMNDGFLFNGEEVMVTQGVHRSVLIHEADYKEKCNDLKPLFKYYTREGLQISLNRKTEYVTLSLHSEYTSIDCFKICMAKAAIEKVMGRGVVVLQNDPSARALLRQEDKKILQTVMDKTGAVLLTDEIRTKVSIHGSQKKILAAQAEVSKFMQETMSKNLETLEVRIGREVLRTLKRRYGNNFSGLKTETNMLSIRYESYKSILKLKGTEQAFDKTFAILNNIRGNLVDDGVLHIRNECSGCFYSVERDVLYRLECCGHSYCNVCISKTMERAIENHSFPIECELEDCPGVLVWKDFVNLSREGHITLDSLVNASVSAYVTNYKNEVRYCSTPNCPIVYKVTREATPFLCPECDVTICTHCHDPYYYGHTCILYEWEKMEISKMYKGEMKKLKDKTKQGRRSKEVRKRGKIYIMSKGNNEKVKWAKNTRTNKVKELRMLMREGLLLEEGGPTRKTPLYKGVLEEESTPSQQSSWSSPQTEENDVQEHGAPGLWQLQLYVCNEGKHICICLLDDDECACRSRQMLLQKKNRGAPYLSWSRHHL